MNLEKRVKKLEDKEEIRTLRYKYCFKFDERDVDGFANLFTDDAILDLTAGTYEGREEIKQYLRNLKGEEGRFEAHMSHNPVLEINGNEAVGRWYYNVPLVWEDGKAGWSQGKYYEEYVREDGEWKFDLIEISSNYRCDYDQGWANEVLPK